MKISLNNVRFLNERYGCGGDPAADGVEKLAEKIGAQLGAIEEIVDYGSRFDGALIVKVVSCIDHPNADRLHVCLIDDNGVAQNVERDENGHVQVVCGAPNVREGLSVVWLPPGTTVPESIGKDPFVLEARALRGVVSNGMLASPRELTLGDTHEGILEINDDIKPGTTFADAYNLTGEYVIDIENKMFTHRPDCFGYLGVARELAGIQQQPYKSPDWYTLDPEIPAVETDELKLEVENQIPDLVPRFTAITMRDVVVKPSPLWLQILLYELGMRPINNIVDYTNYFMLETGQPLHAYDYDKVVAQDNDAKTAKIVVRHPKEGETITLLNGKEIEPRAEAIMITTRDKLIGVGGVMGGADTEVGNDTKNIIIEAANFDMYSIRRTSMAHGLFTDAVTRFNKGQSPLQTKAVLAKIVDEIRRYADGKVAGELIDFQSDATKEKIAAGTVHPSVKITPEFINTRLGVELTAEEIRTLLENVEFTVEQGALLVVTAPFWRTDIQIPEDVVEEVGRLYGYDHLPLILPKRAIDPAKRDDMLDLKQRIRTVLAKGGANEVMTYSFVHGNLIDKVGQDKSRAFQLSNAISPNLQYYRLSLTPSLLDKVHGNIKSGYGEFALFEIGKAHVVGEPDPVEKDVPKEANALSFVLCRDKKHTTASIGVPYYHAKKYLDHLLETFGVSGIALQKLSEADLYNNPWLKEMAAPFDSDRSAVLVGEDNLIWGVVGEYKPAIKKALKLPEFIAGFEIDPLIFMLKGRPQRTYIPLPRFPKVEQDICLKVDGDLSYQELFNTVNQALDEFRAADTLLVLSPVDIYQREDDKAHKHITFRVRVADYNRTMTDAEVTTLLNKAAAAAKAKHQAERV